MPEPGPTGAKKRRLDHVDAMRPVKQAGVVGTHTLLAFAPGASIYVGASLVLLHVTREAFLFVSACMLTYSYRTLHKGDWGRFYQRRFISVGLPYLCWTVIYFFVTFARAGPTARGNLRHFCYLVASGYYQLYYLLVIMQFYVLFPLLLWLLRHTDRHGRILLAGAVFQVTLVDPHPLAGAPGFMQGFWATREVTSYTFYLLAGPSWPSTSKNATTGCSRHARVVVATVAAAARGRGLVRAGRPNTPRGALGVAVGPASADRHPLQHRRHRLHLPGRRLPGRPAALRLAAGPSCGRVPTIPTACTWPDGLHPVARRPSGWRRVTHVVPWPIVSVLTVALVFCACVLLTAVWPGRRSRCR